jgi:hypothetical protein
MAVAFSSCISCKGRTLVPLAFLTAIVSYKGVIEVLEVVWRDRGNLAVLFWIKTAGRNNQGPGFRFNHVSPTNIEKKMKSIYLTFLMQ